jgi:hypothetical protein
MSWQALYFMKAQVFFFRELGPRDALAAGEAWRTLGGTVQGGWLTVSVRNVRERALSSVKIRVCGS